MNDQKKPTEKHPWHESLRNRILLGAGVAAALLSLTVWLVMIGWYNDANSLENTARAQWLSNQNTYDAFWKSVREVAQVPERYKNDFKEVLVAEAEARYGEGGSKATFQWIQERAVNFDASQYRKIQDVIESGRQDFKRSQNELLDKQRKFRNVTTGYWGGLLASHYGFPRALTGAEAPPKDRDSDGRLTVFDYPIVTSTKTERAFKEAKDEEVSVFGQAK